jgi:4-carboxymuconolactone decarboxylase
MSVLPPTPARTPQPDALQPAQGWISLPSPRLAEPPRAQWGWVFRVLSLLARAFGRQQVPAVFSVLNINRRLMLPWLWFASRLMPYGSLPPREREWLILRTGWNTRCRYEWGQHVDIGLQAGLSDDDILRCAQGPQAFAADEPARHLLQACDELCQHDTVSEPTWHALQQRWSKAECIEVLMLVGHYRMLAGFLNAAGLKLEPEMEAKLQAFHGRAPSLQGQARSA